MSMQTVLTMAAVTAGSVFIVNTLAAQDGVFRTVFRPA